MPGRDYQSSLNFPYGYQGQEKDGATGLTNFELRQYDPRIGRWYNPDPYGQHHSPYLAMSNNPVSFTDPDGGWDGFGGSDDQWMAAHFAQMSSQNYFINGDVDSHMNGQENMALVSHAYNEYRAEHYNSELGSCGSWQTGSAHTTYGGETVSEAFVVDPKKKKENPVLFKLNQLNGGGLDFSGAKFGMSSYQNLPWYKTKVDVFGVNSAKSAWNQAVSMTEMAANIVFSSEGRQDIYSGVDNLVKGTMNWLFTTSTDQKVDDIINVATDVHNYENLAGGLMLGGAMTRFSGIGIDPKILGDNIDKLGANIDILAGKLKAQTDNLPRMKVLRESGGKINGFTISKGKGYGAKTRFDVHPLGWPSKGTASFPSWVKGKTLPHYHRGKGNALRRHRPWEKWDSDTRFIDRF